MGVSDIYNFTFSFIQQVLGIHICLTLVQWTVEMIGKRAMSGVWQCLTKVGKVYQGGINKIHIILESSQCMLLRNDTGSET